MKHRTFIRLFAGIIAGILVWQSHVSAAGPDIPYSHFQAPVIHAGRYHVLSCGEVYIVLDSERGYMIERVSYGDTSERGMDDTDIVLSSLRLASETDGAGTIDQSLDTGASLTVIEQGKDRVSAVVECALWNSEGISAARGTIEIYLTHQGVHLVPRIDFDGGQVTGIRSAGLEADVPGRSAGIIMDGGLLMPQTTGRHIPFSDSTAFSAMITNPGRAAIKLGWLNTIIQTDSLAQADSLQTADSLYTTDAMNSSAVTPDDWRRTASSGFTIRYDRRILAGVGIMWTSGDPLTIPSGKPYSLTGPLYLCLGGDTLETHRRWEQFANPLEPVVSDGIEWEFNHREGIYEISSPVDSLDLVFDNIDGDIDLDLAVKVPIREHVAVHAAVNGRKVTPALFVSAPGDSAAGDQTEDEVVEQYAVIGIPVQNGGTARLTMNHAAGLRFMYRARSADEMYELRSPFDESPLFRFSPATGMLSDLRRPGGETSMVKELSLGWKGKDNGFDMTGVRTFLIEENGPGQVRFTWEAAADSGRGLSTATLTAPLDESVLSLNITTEFTPLDSDQDWQTLEYASVDFPGESDSPAGVMSSDLEPESPDKAGEPEDILPTHTGVTVAGAPISFAWLDSTGVFLTSRGTSALPDSDGQFSAGREFPLTVEGPGSGLLWIVGFEADAGGVMFTMGDHTESPGAYPGFSIQPELAGVGNFITGRADSSATETVSYTISLFNGPLPDETALNRMYRDAVPDGGATPIENAFFSPEGVLTGFVMKKE